MNVNTLESWVIAKTYWAESARIMLFVRGNPSESAATAFTINGVAESAIVKVPAGSPTPEPILSAQRGSALTMLWLYQPVPLEK